MGAPNTNQSLQVGAEEMELIHKLEGIFTPASRKLRDEFYQRDPATSVAKASAPFVHYTSAEAALSIIKTKRIWMRNAMSMSDYREVQHGFDILWKFFNDPPKLAMFTTALDSCFPGAAKEAVNLFDKHWPTTRLQTYIASISEHLASEDQHGRLSMWRAFGGNTARVAIVFNFPWNTTSALALNLLFSPVVYPRESELDKQLYQVMENVSANRDSLCSLDRQLIVSHLFLMLLASVICLKHEGFREEREWRAIYSPYRAASPLMESSTQVVGGIPQTIYSIPLDQAVSPALADLEFSKVFDRLIIGPSQYAWPMYEALTAALINAGIPKEIAHQQVRISGIPIRT